MSYVVLQLTAMSESTNLLHPPLPPRSTIRVRDPCSLPCLPQPTCHMHHVGGPNPQAIKAIHNYFGTPKIFLLLHRYRRPILLQPRLPPHNPDQSAWPQFDRPHFHRPMQPTCHVKPPAQPTWNHRPGPRATFSHGWTQPTPEDMAQLKPPLFSGTTNLKCFGSCYSPAYPTINSKVAPSKQIKN
jgi:hypothetical protein